MEIKNKNIYNKPGKKAVSFKWLAVLFLIISLIFLIMPIDFDGPIVGFIDDFFLFMAAFCFAFSQFSKKATPMVKKQLYVISLTFLILAILWLAILMYSPILHWVA